MKQSITTSVGCTTNCYPMAHIAIKKGRVKLYNGNPSQVYLNDKQEFEIELFNPTQKVVAASIAFNGGSESINKIIIRPGERIFLERYLNTDKKFKFETYNVAANDASIDGVILRNGLVTIKFYDESYPYALSYPYAPNVINLNNSYTYFKSEPFGSAGPFGNHGQFYCQSQNIGTSGLGTTTTAHINNNSAFASGTTNVNLNESRIKSTKELKQEKETGRIEQGSKSNQEFGTSNITFNSFYSSVVDIKILPVSQQIYSKEDIKTYCTECGSRRKKDSHRFCSNCGTKFE